MRLISFLVIFLYSYGQTLSLEQAIKSALSKNRDLIVSSYGPKKSSFNILKEEGRFDLSLESSVNFTQDKSAIQFTSDSTNYNIELSKYNSFGTDISIQYQKDIIDSNPPFTLSSSTPRFDSSLGLSLSQNLLRNFGTTVNNTHISISKKMLQSEKYKLLEATLLILYKVQIAYWNLFEAQQKYTLELFSLSLIEELLKQKERMVELGGFAKALLLDIKASRADSFTLVADSKRSLEVAKLEFLEVIGLQNIDIELSDRPFEYDVKYSEDKERYIDNHPMVLINNINVESLKQMNSFYENQMLPSLSLDVGFETHNPSISDNSLSPYKDNHNVFGVGLQFSMSIDNSVIKSDLGKGRLSELEYKANENRIKFYLKSEITKAIANIKYIKELLFVAKQSVDIQKSIIKNEDKKLELGLTTMKNYLDNMKELTKRQIKLLEYEASMMRYFATYYNAVASTPEFLNIDISELR
ncbi:hypothetical protein GJV85_07110 [Sulfurimonas aquatica]|uniref:TolC family protein n=1 Tax=Sulfurimonas aquatica TaxID=2672570 RepID=A0A975B0B2_9BACT|nr:TolC family protein [Sulfurimonas aquatica]QSZ41884.1 hypothetical protein GJV85_07110 [Sulfurimonas aquatica]